MLTKKNTQILIIGNGMYVSGRGTDGFGTILPAVLEYQRGSGKVSDVSIVGTNRDHSLAAEAKANELMTKTGVSVKLNVYPDKVEKDNTIYKNALNGIGAAACAIVSVPDHLHHEIKTPLTILLNSLENMAREGDKEFESRIKSTVIRINALFEQILNFQNITSSKFLVQDISKIQLDLL